MNNKNDYIMCKDKETIKARPIDFGANYTVYQTEYKGYPIYFRDNKITGKRRFKITEELIKSGFVKVSDDFDLKEYLNKWIEL